MGKKSTEEPRELRELQARLREVYDLRRAALVLQWDQWTHMPAGGVEGRARQLALVRRLAHERFVDPRIGELLEALGPLEEEHPRLSYEASLIRVTRRDYERETRVPAGFVRRSTAHSAISYAAWLKAKEEDDFGVARPHLERRLELSLELAGFHPDAGHPADPLVGASDPGMGVEKLRGLFGELREGLVPLAGRLGEQELPNDSFMRQRFPARAVLGFAEGAIGALGYDFSRGRHDAGESPFMSKLSAGDVRIVTWDREGLGLTLFATLHEAGHALYEQGIPEDLDGTPLGEGNSRSLHESQARLVENTVGRGEPFWKFFYPRLRERFPRELGSVPLRTFLRAINRVEPTLIRVAADEVTYNLHAIMRFDFELAMLEGKLAPRDLPDAWRERMRLDLGVAPGSDREGCLQDPHWYDEAVGGMFHGYAVGNLLAAQFYEAMLREQPGLPHEMAAGECGALRGWLRENVWRHGGKLSAEEVALEATGSPISTGPLLEYVRSKYGRLYGVRL
ncbi:MAG: carboxypeptidase M32 [Actinomycetota bacterium]|nr:carboxypeptidase M32 [Actinomycetota bacterium]